MMWRLRLVNLSPGASGRGWSRAARWIARRHGARAAPGNESSAAGLLPSLPTVGRHTLATRR